jgi:hypothetical protein
MGNFCCPFKTIKAIFVGTMIGPSSFLDWKTDILHAVNIVSEISVSSDLTKYQLNTSSISTLQFVILLVLILILGEIYLFIYQSLFNDVVNAASYKALNEGIVSNN